jgi:uncharacterized protein
MTMADLTRPCTYFEQPGICNTAAVVGAVVQRCAEGDLRTVVAASTTGYTTLALAEALREQEGVTLIHMGHGARVREWGSEYPTLKPEARRELVDYGVVVADQVSYIFHNSILEFSRWNTPSAEDIVRDTLYAFGQGLKVAVEVVLMAVATGFFDPFQDVIAIGGTERGADTAIVVRATYPNHVLSKDAEKCLRIREILCMPH